MYSKYNFYEIEEIKCKRAYLLVTYIFLTGFR